MARALSAAATLVTSLEADYLEIENWYRNTLDRTPPPADLVWEPIKVGPTWQWDNGWLLPEATLGWSILAWCGHWLTGKGRKPWAFTPEQARFLLWYYALESNGEYAYHSAAFQRLKGHGKDPLAATISVASLHAPVVFDHWDGDRPVGRDEPDAWTQVCAVSQDQTKNTMKLFPSLISREAQRYYGIQIGKLNVWSDGDRRQIEAVTSSVASIEGGRPKQIIRNETQNWNSSNGGHDMAGAIEGNAAKSEVDAPARVLDIFNAYRPGEGSVAQRTREAWEATQGDEATALDFGLLYDSLEAPPDAPLTAEAAPDVVRSIAGDATWLDVDGRILKSILDTRNPPSESRRKWYNQITAAEDAYTTPQLWDPLADSDAVIESGDEVALFLDCSKSDDATALLACRISDGFRKTLGMWQKPPQGRGGKDWTAPREKVDAAVQAAFTSMRPVAFFVDPSHVLEDESFERYWDGLCDEWHRRYKDKLRVWAKPGKQVGHAVMFDMTELANQKKFVTAVQVTAEEIEQGVFRHDGDARTRNHMLNAKRQPTQAGLSIAKDHRESRKKIDLAVCVIGSGMARRMVLNIAPKRGGRVW